MDDEDIFVDIWDWIKEKLSEMSYKAVIVVVIVGVLVYGWFTIPNPWSIKITPLENNSSILSQDETLKTNMYSVKGDFSLIGETVSMLGSESKMISTFKDIESMAETSDNLRFKDETITVPEDAGIITWDEIKVYNWKKAYCRFFIDGAELYQDNIIIVMGNQIVYIYGGQNGYTSFNINIEYGKFQ